MVRLTYLPEDPRRRRRRFILRLMPAMAYMLAVGGAMTFFGFRDEPGMGLFGLSSVSFIGVAWASAMYELRLMRRGPQPRLVTAMDGSPGTALGRVPAVQRLGTAGVAAILVPLLAGCTLAVARGAWDILVLLVPVALWLVAHLVALARGQARLGGLVLTPSGAEWVEDANWWRVSWEDVVTALPREPVEVLVRDGAEVESGRTTWVTWWRRRPREGGPLMITTRYVPGGPLPVAAAIRAGVDEPRRRAWFGTPTSLLPGGTVPLGVSEQ